MVVNTFPELPVCEGIIVALPPNETGVPSIVIDELVNDWAKENLTQEYQKLLGSWDEMSEEEKSEYTDAEDFIQMDCSRWWADSFPDLEVDLKKKLIQRFRLTVSVCMGSNTYDSKKIKESGNV